MQHTSQHGNANIICITITCSYNITVNHRRRIIHSTRGGPGRWNDKTMILFDTFVKGIHDNDYLHDVEFELFERRHGDIVTKNIEEDMSLLIMDICDGLQLFLLTK